jgi:8-oxo-dGTP diphosphatase
MQRMIRVVAAVIEHHGRLLICQRRRGEAFELKWEFPGGKIQGGETPRAALARELREELGIAVTIGREIFRTRYHYVERGVRVELSFFAASRPFPGSRNVVFERIAWVWPSDLVRYDFLAADRALISRLVRGELEHMSKGTAGGNAKRESSAPHPRPAPGR